MKKVVSLISVVVIFFTILCYQSRSFAHEKFVIPADVAINNTCQGYMFRIIDEKTKQPLKSCYIQCGRDSSLGSFTDENGFSSCIAGIDKTKPVNCDVFDLYRKYQDKRFYISPNSKDTIVLEMKMQ